MIKVEPPAYIAFIPLLHIQDHQGVLDAAAEIEFHQRGPVGYPVPAL